MLLAPPPLIPQHSIRGIALGTSRHAVVRRLGRPPRVIRGHNGLGPFSEFRYRGLRIVFAFDGGASLLETRSRQDRMYDGVGVGSREARVRAALPGIRCVTEARVRHCHLGDYHAGAIVTDFFLTRGKVSRITIGRVLD